MERALAVTNPWVGLRPFATYEEDLFFGREREAKILANLVATLPILIVYAPSGTGKSSLINAGLMPELEADATHVPVVVDGPRSDPRERTISVLEAQGWEPSDELAVGTLGLDELVEHHWLDTGRRAVVIMDQFEERVNAGVPTGDLFAAMAKMAHGGTDAACVILSLREDYLGSLEPLMSRVPGLLNGSYRVPSLSRAALEEAVRGPLTRVAGDIELEDSLVGHVLGDLEQRSIRLQEPGEQRFEPGYFQIVWHRLWETAMADDHASLTVSAYQQLGGAWRILEDFTARILDSLEPVQAHVFWAISRYLVLPTGAKSPHTVKDLEILLQPNDFLSGMVTTKTPWIAMLPPERRLPLIRAVLDRLTASDAPLFQRVIRSDREEFELLHDLLGKILLEWREAYKRREIERLSNVHAELNKVAETRVKDIGLTMPTGDDDGAVGRGIISDTTAELAAFAKRLSGKIAEGDCESLVETSDRGLVSNALAEAFRYKLGADYPYELTRDWQNASEEVGRAMISPALDHPSERVRRALQRLIPFWQPNVLDVFVRVPERPRDVAARVVLGSVLSLVPFVAAYLVFRGATNDLGVDYVWLTLANAVVVGAMIYVAWLGGITGQTPLQRALRLIADPFVERRELSLRLRMLPFAWPLPVFLTSAAGLAGAAVFDAAGWASTAGYNLGVLYGGIAAAAGSVWVMDS
jgi:hypothetical protein